MEAEKESEFKNVPTDSAKNWTEDYFHENGMYQNRCHECKELFFGHKRRVICKVCFNKPLDWEAMAKKKPPTQHESWAWQGCWADGEMTGFAKCMVKEVFPLRDQLAAKQEYIGKKLGEGYDKDQEIYRLRDQLAEKERENVALREALKELLPYAESKVRTLTGATYAEEAIVKARDLINENK